MAITNFDNLVKAIIKFSHRDDLSVDVPDFISFAEEAMYNNEVEPLKLRVMEFTSTATTSGLTLALPTNFEYSRSMRIVGDYGEIRFATPEALRRQTGTGLPTQFTIIGEQIEFNIVPDSGYTVELQYFRKATPISSANQTNEILTKNPLIYLNGALVELFTVAQDYDQVALYQQRFIASIKGANKAAKKARYGNAPAVMLDGAMTP